VCVCARIVPSQAKSGKKTKLFFAKRLQAA